MRVLIAVIFSISLADTAGPVSGSELPDEEAVGRVGQVEEKVVQTNILGTINDLDSSQKRFSQQLKSFENQISRLLHQQEISNSKQQILEARVTKLEYQASSYKSRIEEQKSEVDYLKTLLKLGNERKCNEELEDIKDDSPSQQDNAKQNGGHHRRSFPETPVSFTAVLDHNVAHAGIDQTVVFNHVLLNDGNAYNNHTGVFTVPQEGLYLFYFAFGAGYEPHKLWMHIVVDGKGKASGVADTWQQGHDAQGTNLVMLHLQKGDSVWVATYRVADKSIYGFDGGFTTFSGVMLYEY